MFILQENEIDGDDKSEDWNSGWNSWRNSPSNLKQNTCNTDNFTLMKNGGTSRPATYGTYCKYYFSENHSCLRNTCSFLHVPRSGDEKFCMATVQRFTVSTNPVYVKRAVDVFTGYYKMCSPGLCFNVEVVTGLLASLIRLGFLSDTFVALNLLLGHNIRPPAECVLAVFEHACKRKFNKTVPQLIYLISKVVENGCVFSVDQCERLQKCLECLNAPQSQMDVFIAVKCRALANICVSPEMFNVAHAFIDLELCKKQEDWKQMAAVFLRVCASPCTTSHLLKFCVSVATALLVESSQCRNWNWFTGNFILLQELFHSVVISSVLCVCVTAVTQVSDEGLDRNFLGRIGISVLIHYHRTQQWSKGQKIVEILSQQQPCYSVMKGVFSNEDTTSRCSLITMATELHLHSGSMEGALNVLKENNWFVSCSKWPCERGDVMHRVAVQTRLAQCTSHRDALEVLMHLPGLQPLDDSTDVGEYTGLFNSLLRSCLERSALLVAADALEFMLGNGLHAELLLVQNLICDLGKRNRWNRARILFQRALKVGYYPLVEVVPGSLVLELPSSLNEVEMAVCLEMFMCRNIPHSPDIPNISPAPVVTLKRASNNGSVPESEYLSAGCRLLSSAQLPNPKLRLSYTTVNPQQEQVYTIEPGSAHNWLSYNHSWAHRLWSV
ncbi:protein TOPAZ1 [Alosa alosa]|uniref:protein TOPAZ1 n=1 Tax=Alosa alosa TaxID=278164 RepID=UPI0020153AAA|nr:protein TOPAZ1 [Alosa alosa]